MDPTIAAAALVTVIAAVVAGTVTIITAIASARERQDSRESRARIEESTKAIDNKSNIIIEKAAEIHTVTNSNLSRVTEALNVALTEIDGLKNLIRERENKVRKDDSVGN